MLGSPEEIVALRVLVVEENTVEALAIQRELGGRFDLRVAATLAEALSVLTKSGWRPEVLLANPTLPDWKGSRPCAPCRMPPPARRSSSPPVP